MGIFGRLTNLGKGIWKVKQAPDIEFTEALEREIEATTTAEQKAKAAARLRNMKNGEAEVIAESEAAEPEESHSPENPPKKTL